MTVEEAKLLPVGALLRRGKYFYLVAGFNPGHSLIYFSYDPRNYAPKKKDLRTKKMRQAYQEWLKPNIRFRTQWDHSEARSGFGIEITNIVKYRFVRIA
jgi:hypothetical protein